MSGACDGIRVVDFSWWMVGPLATMVLADYGAEVIKVEPPDGDPARDLPAFQTWNRGKESVVLDLKTDAGRERALELIRTADVVVTGFRPGVAERLGIGFAQVHEANPRAIYASVSGYGSKGTRRHLHGYDALVAAKSGRMTIYEHIADRPGPGFIANPYCSFSTAMLLTQGILAALRSRRQTGVGQEVSVSMLAALLPFDLNTWILPQFKPVDPDAKKDTRHFATSIGRTYDSQRLSRPDVRVPRPSIWCGVTKDGVWLWIENTAQHLCVEQMTALDLLHLYEQERFAQLPAVFNEDDGEALWQILLERVRSKTYEEWRQIFDGHKMGWERLAEPLEALEHRQVIHNGHRVEVPGLEDQPTLQPGALVRCSESETRIGRRAPRLGEHTEQPFDRAESAEPALPPDAARAGKRGPLSGITVIDMSTWLAGAFAPTILAELGARVIAVEPLGGEPGRYLMGGVLALVTSPGKESIALDLKRPEGREIVHKLIAQADILYHNLRTGVPERLAVDYETCKKLNPQLIYLNASAYGDSGPDRARPAFAGTIAAMSGYGLRQAGGGHPAPESQTLDMEDLKKEAWRLARTVDGSSDVCAAMGAVTAALLGLQARDSTGVGQALMTTMVCSNMLANSDELIAYDGRPPIRRADADLFGLGPLYRLYETSDGWVFLACVRRKEWEAFCAAVGKPELQPSWGAGWQSDGASQEGEALATTIAELLLARPAAEWEAFMAEHDVPLVAVELRTPGLFSLEDEELRAQGFMVSVHSSQYGDYLRHGALHQFSADEPRIGAWEPVGGHTRAILSELGYSEEQIDRLLSEKLVEVPDET